MKHHQQIALHIPIVGIHKDNPKGIQSFADLAGPGVKIGIGNKDMCSLGRISKRIIAKSEGKESLMKNTVIQVSKLNELFDLLNRKKVDAVIIWTDMLHWPGGEDLQGLTIPSEINEIKEIHAAVLSLSENPKWARIFSNFVASEGKAVFAEYGFSRKPGLGFGEK